MVIHVYKDRVEFIGLISLSDAIDIGMFIKENDLKIDEFYSNRIIVNSEMKILTIIDFGFNADIVIKIDEKCIYR